MRTPQCKLGGGGSPWPREFRRVHVRRQRSSGSFFRKMILLYMILPSLPPGGVVDSRIMYSRIIFRGGPQGRTERPWLGDIVRQFAVRPRAVLCWGQRNESQCDAEALLCSEGQRADLIKAQGGSASGAHGIRHARLHRPRFPPGFSPVEIGKRVNSQRIRNLRGLRRCAAHECTQTCGSVLAVARLFAAKLTHQRGP